MPVTILMSAYNEPLNIFRQAVDSILAQTYKDFEFIIILDNPDNEVLENEIKRYALNDSRIVFVKNETNLGLVGSLNKGVALAKGKFIARMDADDISMPNRLETELAELESDEAVSVVSTDKTVIDENGAVAEENSLRFKSNAIVPELMKYSCLINHSSVMFRRDVVLKYGGYRDVPAAEDYDLWLRLLLDGEKIKVIFEKLICYRVRRDGISQKNIYAQKLSMAFLQKNYRRGRSIDLEELRRYLRKNGCDGGKAAARYARAAESYNLAKELFAAKKPIRGCLKLIKALFIHKSIVHSLLNSICYNGLIEKEMARKASEIAR